MRETEKSTKSVDESRSGHKNGCEAELFEKSISPQTSLNDSLEGEVCEFLTDGSQLHTFDDLTKVNPVTPTTVLKCLQARYSAQVFYTQAGCTLVALNPFQPFPELYSLEMMKQYHAAPQPQKLKPHVFIVAEEAYRNIRDQQEPLNQSLVVSGESGAGKTWTSRCLMKYYATVAASSSALKSQSTVERIERRVLDSNPIMEAFGNACTLQNNNSSRFGKFIQLQLNSGQLLVGASVQTYLLEKTRVSCQPASERNFHIFYQMMRGATDEQRTEWKMPLNQSFDWLPNSDKQIEEDVFEETVEAMLHMGIKAENQGHILRILAGILHLGNVRFSFPGEEHQLCQLPEDSEESMETAAMLLSVPAKKFLSCLRVRTLNAGKQSVLKPCSQSECGVRRDCLAKTIYSQLFEWLVTFINNNICADKSTWSSFIGVLDVYGFECFHVNKLEQLCINYANEKLQQHFVAHYLKAQQEEYVSEGLQWSFVKYQDNQSCLDLIEGNPVCVFSLLNEESRLNRASDPNMLRARLEKELSDNPNISWDKFSRVPHFRVAHYAGRVSYQIEGMVEKNKDPVPAEIIGLLQKSDNPLLCQIFADRGTENSKTRGLTKVTVVSKFKNSLESLMSILLNTTPHYTRCIKPNPDCRPLTFKQEEVILQLEALGIVQTIHISAAGFPVRIPFKSFMQRYGMILRHLKMRRSSDDLRVDIQQKVEQLLSAVLNQRSCDDRCSLVHCGRTKVFLTQAMLDVLEDQRSNIRSRCAFSIQCCWLRYQRRRRLARRQSTTLIQAAVRSWLVRKQVQRWNRAAAVIQRRWKHWKTVLKLLAEAELDDTTDLLEDGAPPLNPIVWERGVIQLPGIQEPVRVRGWPLGLAWASAPSIAVSLTATGFQRLVSVVTSLKLPSVRGEYSVEINQYKQGLASIRAQPKGPVKLHCRRSPLLYADTQPDLLSDMTGFNEILQEQTL